MHKIYQDAGAFDFIYQIPKMLYSSILSFFLINIIKKLGLFENNIMNIKYCKSKEINDIKAEESKCIKIKVIFFFIITYIILFALWIYLGCFCSVYKNTQIHLLKEVASSFGISLLTPFLVSLIPGIFRIPSLRTDKKERKPLLYKFSQFIQKLC